MKINKAFFLFTLLIVSIYSCTPEKRMARMIRKHPSLTRIDTTWKSDTVHIAGASVDTSFHYYTKDTVVMKSNQLTVKYYFNKDSTVYLSGKCDPIIKRYFFPVVKVVTSVPAQLTFNERVILWISRNWWWLLGIYFLFRMLWKVFGKALKVYFPWLSMIV